jgi:hypothetical protein
MLFAVETWLTGGIPWLALGGLFLIAFVLTLVYTKVYSSSYESGARAGTVMICIGLLILAVVCMCVGCLKMLSA